MVKFGDDGGDEGDGDDGGWVVMMMAAKIVVRHSNANAFAVTSMC